MADSYPVTRSTKQNRQGNGPEGVKLDADKSVTDTVKAYVDPNKAPALDAMDEARKAMGLPPRKKQ